MTDEVLDLAKHLEYLNIDEEQVLRLAQSFKSLNIDQRREIEGDIFRKFPPHLQTQLRKILDLLVHISQCRTPRCQYPYCGKAKGLIRHGFLCKTRSIRGCHVCKKMWHILQLHAVACKESNCNLPRCRDLKDSRPEAVKLADILNVKGTHEQLRKTLDLVVHISRCPSAYCLYPNCGEAKGLFRHSGLCKTRVVGGCLLCKILWRTLRFHAQECKESNCNVPRCRDINEYNLHLISRQGAAAEVACSS